MKRYMISLLCLLLLLFTTLPNAIAETTRPFIILAEEYPPYEYLENDRPKGINVDIIDTIMKRLGISYKIKFYPWSRLWLLAKKGKGDAIMTISHRREREPYVFYTDLQKQYYKTGKIPRHFLWLTEYVFFINNMNANKIRFNSLNQLKKGGYKIGVIKDYSYNPDFLATKLTLVNLPSSELAFQKLLEGKIDLYPCDRTVGLTMLRKLGLSDKISYLPKSVFIKPYLTGFLTQSSYPNIRQVMTDFYNELDKMKKSGEYAQIYERYQPTGQAGRKLIFVCEEWMPFEYLKDGRPTGINVELVKYIMSKLRIPYEIRFYPWARAWMMIKKGKVDATLSVSYKPSREKYLHYTAGQKAFDKTGQLPKEYLWLSEYVFFIKKKNRHKLTFKSYQQLKKAGYKIGTNKGYAYNPEFRAAKLKSSLIVNNTKEGFEALISGKIDLYPIDRTIGLTTIKDMGLEGSITYLPKILFAKPYLCPYVKTSTYPNLNRIMTDFYRELNLARQSGLYSQITDKYTLKK